MPIEVVTKVNAALNKALQHPETTAFFKAQGVQAVIGSPQDFGKFINTESIKWGALIKSANVKPD